MVIMNLGNVITSSSFFCLSQFEYKDNHKLCHILQGITDKSSNFAHNSETSRLLYEHKDQEAVFSIVDIHVA